MTRGVQLLLIVGCCLVALVELPGALRSLGEGWSGPYAPAGVGAEVLAMPVERERADATAEVASSARPQRTPEPRVATLEEPVESVHRTERDAELVERPGVESVEVAVSAVPPGDPVVRDEHAAGAAIAGL